MLSKTLSGFSFNHMAMNIIKLSLVIFACCWSRDISAILLAVICLLFACYVFTSLFSYFSHSLRSCDRDSSSSPRPLTSCACGPSRARSRSPQTSSTLPCSPRRPSGWTAPSCPHRGVPRTWVPA